MCIKAIDENDRFSGIHIFRRDCIQILSTGASINYYNALDKANALKTLLPQTDLNSEFFSWRWDLINELFQIILEKEIYVSLELTNGEYYSGKIIYVTPTDLRMQELSYLKLEKQAITLPIKNIVSISVTEFPNYLAKKWNEETNNFLYHQNLVNIYLDYYDDTRENLIIGEIIQENNEKILLGAIDGLGILDSLTVIEKRFIRQINSQNLKYENFIVYESKKNGYFDLYQLLSTTVEILDFSTIIKGMQINQVFSVNGYYFDNQNVGILKKANNRNFKIQNFDNYQLGNESEFEYQDLVSVDLVSSQIKNYNLWFNKQR
ncbi:hypothetical protein [Lactobacillus intestinalis]|uniref:hypothetical protein n=1 Tax=Lactobacillus intestinalis TaxID=151781 RepID=UPI0012ED3FF2|nr:hypothetical protein [Lactobacillus intestinalis]